MDALNIFKFFDYREFLVVAFAKLKRAKNHSLRTVAKLSGFSPGFLPQVLAGQKNLSDQSAAKLIPIFELSDAEGAYFKLLVKLSLATAPAERLRLLKLLPRFHEFRQQNPQEIEALWYLSKWYNVVIRELTDVDDFQEDPKWIQKQLIAHVSAVDIKKSLRFLETNKFLVRNGSGRLVQSNKIINCQEGVFRLALGSFHRQMLSLASDSIDNVKRERRSIMGYTLSLKAADFNEIQKILDEAQKKINDLERNKMGSDAVIHIAFAAFPVTGRK